MTRPRTINVPPGAGTYHLDNACGRLLLTNLAETAGAVAGFVIYDGPVSATSPLLVVAQLPAHGTFYERHGAWLLPYRVGLTIVTTGTLKGSVTVHNVPPDHPIGEPVLIVGTLDVGPITIAGGNAP